MSAQFLVTFRGQPVRFTHRAAKRIWEIVPRSMASVFNSQASAKIVAAEHDLRPVESIAVEPLQKLEAA